MAGCKGTYRDELEFERDLVHVLADEKGWRDGVLHNPSEADLIRNWADILFQNDANRGRTRLNGVPLSDGEIAQLVEQVHRVAFSPAEASRFINCRTVSITRDNPEDRENIGREISLSIYD